MQTALAWGMFLPLAYLFGIQLDPGLTVAWVGGTCYVTVPSFLLVAPSRRARSLAAHV